MNRGSRIQSTHERYDTAVGHYMREREKRLILDLTEPKEGEYVLSVGRGARDTLIIFRTKGCCVTGIEQPSGICRRESDAPEEHAHIFTGAAEDLPFSDNQFDLVALIGALEFTQDPETAIAEAIRVCRDRVFLGVTNKYSFASFRLNTPSQDQTPIRLYHPAELRTMVKRQIGRAEIQWGSVLFLPQGWYRFAAVLEEAIPVRKNPFGSFFGLSFAVNYTYRTIQEPLTEALHFLADAGRPVPGAIRETNHARGNTR